MVNLSEEVYEGTNVSAVAVTKHECGHAVSKCYSLLYAHF